MNYYGNEDAGDLRASNAAGASEAQTEELEDLLDRQGAACLEEAVWDLHLQAEVPDKPAPSDLKSAILSAYLQGNITAQDIYATL